MSDAWPGSENDAWTSRGERTSDVWRRLVEDRIVYLGTPINETTANMLIGQLMLLLQANSERDVHLYINSPGGSIQAGLKLYDMIQFIPCPVETVCIGSASGMAAVLLAAGTPGKRFTLPNSRVMLSEPFHDAPGSPADIDVLAEELLEAWQNLCEIFARHTGRSIEEVRRIADGGRILSAKEAMEYGLVDEIIGASTG